MDIRKILLCIESEEHTKRQRVRVIIRDNEGDSILMSFSCENMGSCTMYSLITNSLRIIQLQPLIAEYCLNLEKYRECMRYKMKEKVEKPPDNLLPNGKMLEF